MTATTEEHVRVAIVGAGPAGIGTAIGLIAGYYGGLIDELLMRIVDIWFSIPFILFALVVVLSFEYHCCRRLYQF